LLLGLFGITTVVVLVLLRRDPLPMAGRGPRWWRRVLGLGLAALGLFGVAGACGQTSPEPGSAAAPNGEPAEKPGAAPAAPEKPILIGTRFDPALVQDLDRVRCRLQHLCVVSRATVDSLVVGERARALHRLRRERSTTCYIIRLPPGPPALATPSGLLQRLANLERAMQMDRVTPSASGKVIEEIKRLMDELWPDLPR
jgi:hypothetical protein